MEIVDNHLRRNIVWLVAGCIAVAMAPWLSGGQLPVAALLSGMAMLLGSLILWRQTAVRHFRGGPLSWYYAAFVVLGIMSLWWSVNRFSTVLWVVPLVIAGLAFRLAYTISGTNDGREAVVRLYIASAVIFCVYALWLYLTGGYERLTGSFYWANPAAAYLMPAIIISLHRAWRVKWQAWAPLAVLFGSCFMLTDSRGASLVLVLALIIYSLILRSNKQYWITLVFTAISTIILTFSFVQLRQALQPQGVVVAPTSRIAEAISGESKSGNDRVAYLVAAYKIWLSAPLIGTGGGTYGDVHPAYQTSPINASASAHNIYAEMFPDLGIIGFVLLCGVLISLPLGLLRGYAESSDNLVFILGAGALLVHFGLDIDTRYPSLIILAAVLLGLAYTQSYRDWRQMSWRIPTISAIVMIPIVSWYLSNSTALWGAAAQANNDYTAAAEYFAVAGDDLVHNPDWLNSAGINYYTLAATGKDDAKLNADNAMAAADAAQAEDPRDGQHHQLAGRVWMLRRNYVAAIREFEMALKLDPYDHPAYALDLATAQLALNKRAEALETATAMLGKYPTSVIDNRVNDLTLRPNLADLAALAGNEYFDAANYDQAQHFAAWALSLNPDSLKGRALQHRLDVRTTTAQ